MSFLSVASIAALAGAPPVSESVVMLTQRDRAGTFVWRSGDRSAAVASDPQQGLYVRSATASPATGCWVREWDGTHGRPEWFGARTGDPAFDNRPALNACVALCPVTTLAPADYWLGGRWTVSTSHRSIIGVGRNGNGSSPVTRLLLDSATSDIVMVGTDANPGHINAFVQYVDLSNVTIGFPGRPTPPHSGRQGGPSCLRGQYILNCTFANISTINGTNGYYFTGAVYCELRYSSAQRLNNGTTSTNDYFIGCMIDGSPEIGANTGIASLYVKKLSVTGTTKTPANYGVYTSHGFTDMFIDSVETSGVDYGIYLTGNSGKPHSFESEDCKIFNCVLDGVKRGIVAHEGAQTTAVVLMNNYIATAAKPSGNIGIEISSTPASGTGGSISLIGNQIIGIGGNATGYSIAKSRGVISSGNILTDLNAPVAIANSSQLRLTDRISNPTQPATAAAITLSDSARVVIDCSIDGKTGAFAAGIALPGAGNSVIEARMTGIDAGAVAGGAANKLVSNGSQITASGPFGSGSLAQGIMG